MPDARRHRIQLPGLPLPGVNCQDRPARGLPLHQLPEDMQDTHHAESETSRASI